MHRISVDLPEPDGPITTTTSCDADLQVDVLQRLEVAEELVDVFDLDHHVGRRDRCGIVEDGSVGGRRFVARCLLAHRIPTPSLFSSRWLSRLIVYDTIQNISAANVSVSAIRP